MKFVRFVSLSLSVPILALSVVACSKSSAPPPQPPQTTSTTIVREPAQPATPAPAPAEAQPPASSTNDNNSAAPTMLNDDEIATTLAAASMGEIEISRLAKAKAKDPRVKAFAAQMVTDHTDATHKQVAMMNKVSLKIEENAASMQLMTDDSNVLDTLKAQTGADFDRTYIDSQVKDQTQLLDLIDHKFLPGAKNSELRAFIDDFRPMVVQHLKAAQDLQKSLTTK